MMKRKSRSLTLLEVVIVILLAGLMAGFGAFTLKDLLFQHRTTAAMEAFKELVEEMQIEALALRSDLELLLYQDKKGWKARNKSSEKILKSREVELKGVHGITWNQRPQKGITLEMLSSGRFSPPGVLCLRRELGDIWIDLREPLQIKFSSAYPECQSLPVPEKPRRKNGAHQ